MASSLALLCALSLLALALFSCSGRADTHWLVSENGLIQPREDPSFDLARYDLVAFLIQDSLRDEIIQTYHSLIARKTSVRELWEALENDADLDTFIKRETDCITATLDGVDLYPAVVDSIRRDEETRKWISKFKALDVKDEPPDCAKYSSLPFSLATFDHLEAMRYRDTLSIDPEPSLAAWLPPADNMNSFGRQLSEHLADDSASWVHYALASVYWKVKGDSHQAMECSRRAVLYAPRKYKDIALLGMGNIFHRAKRPLDARTLFQAAADHAPEYGLNHFALGNAHAALGDFNSSVGAYEAASRLGSLVHARRNRQGARCQLKVMGRVRSVQTLLRQIHANISEYSALESHWWRQQAAFLNTMKQYDGQFADVTELSLDSICSAMEKTIGLYFCNLKKDGDKHSLIQLYLRQSQFPALEGAEPESLEAALGLQDTVREVSRQMREISGIMSYTEHLRARDGTIKSETHFGRDLSRFEPLRIGKNDFLKGAQNVVTQPNDEPDVHTGPGKGKEQAEKKTQSEFREFEGGTVLYPPTYSVNRYREDFDTKDDWPPRELCDEWEPRFPTQLDTVYPVFLPFENKGLLVERLLSDKIGLTLQEEHPLPWHPPVCREIKGSTSSALPRLPKSAQRGEGVPTEALRRLLLQYAGDGRPERAQHMHEAEIGQRILTAHKKKVAPKWILYTLSSLYWRVRNNNANALTCLASADKLAPAHYRDIIQTSLASVLLEVGYAEEALAVATQAFRLNLHEPATNFLLSLIHMVKNNRMAHVFHMRQVVRVQPGYMDGLARTLLYAWSCKFARTVAVEKEATEGVCYEGTHMNGQRAACAADEESCARTPVHAFKHHGYKLEDEISTIMRLLDLKMHARGSEMDEGSMERPEERAEPRHLRLQQRYRVLDNMLKNCGEEDCSNFYQVKAEEVQGHSCFFQHLRFWYWLPYLRLENLLLDRGIRLNEKLKLEQKAQYKFPDCRAPLAHGDPTLEWLSRVPADGWRPVTDLIEEVAGLLGEHGSLEDVSSLLAYHVERQGSWLGFLVAGLWCGGFARGACCVRCFAAAVHAAPPRHRDVPLLSLVAVLHLQDKVKEAKHAAYLALPLAPKSKLHLFVVGISHTYIGEYESAIRMFRAALTQEPGYAVARACLQATMCLVLFMDELAAGHP